MIKKKGFDKLMKKLGRLEKTAAKRAQRKATRAGTSVLLKAVKAATPKDEGLLRKMQASKVTTRGMTAFGAVGADVDKLKAAEASGSRPSNIDYLVEQGHVTPDGKFVPPSGYMRRAADGAMPKAEDVYLLTLQKEIEAEATR